MTSSPSFRRVLVTGGAGFIGSALVEGLNKKGVEKIVVADFLGTDEKWRNLASLVLEDVVDARVLLDRISQKPDAFGDFDCVLHMGACSATTERDAAYLIENNTHYTMTLCEWALKLGARFVYASSAATYGDGAKGMDDRADIRGLRPLNAYGWSKQLFDLQVSQRGYMKHIAGLKYFNVFGPNEYHKGDMRSLVCKAYQQIVDTGEIKLFKSHRPDYRDGEQMRDFIYVKDAVAATMHLAGNNRANGLFNVGSGLARTWLDLAHAIFTALQLEPKIQFVEMPESIRDQYQYHTCADISKIRSVGHDKPGLTLEAAVNDYVTNYLVPHRFLGEG